MKRPKLCTVCENHADGITPTHGVDYSGIHELGVCPACRKACEIGRRVEGMKPRKCTAKVWNGSKFIEISGLFHGFFQNIDADEAYPVAIVEAESGIIYRPLAEDVVMEENP